MKVSMRGKAMRMEPVAKVHERVGMGTRQASDSRLVVVSNRLPVRIKKGENGEWRVRPSSGGLVTALHPVLSRRGGSWTGWSGTCGHPPEELARVLENADPAFKLRTVPLTVEERDRYYLGFSNRVLWPLFHGFSSLVEFRRKDWEAYVAVNWKFADTLARGRPTDAIWVQDYHLMLLGMALRLQGYAQRMGFFLHIPFPSPKAFHELPTHREILQGLLHYDFLGFQTGRDRENFLATLQAMPPGELGQVHGRRGSSRPRPVSRHLPISIDFDEWSSRALKARVTARVAEIRKSMGTSTFLLLGVDRLDYSKGIPAKLEGLKHALGRFPELRDKVTLVQLVVPSREGIPAYREQKRRIEALVEEVNSTFGHAGWTPIRYVYGEWEREELTAHYRAADAALISPIRDGMNLVSKEYCASRVREAGALILSRGAGAVGQLGEGALLVDPGDPDEVARAIARATTLPLEERRNRMGLMRKSVMEEDVHWWADAFLGELDAVRAAHPPLSLQLGKRRAFRTGTRSRSLEPTPLAARGA